MSGSSSLIKKYAVNHENKYCSEIFRFMFSGIDFEIDQKKMWGVRTDPSDLGSALFLEKMQKNPFF